MEEYPFEFTKPLLLCFDLLNRCNIAFFDEKVPFVRRYWRFFYMIPFVLVHFASITAYMSKIFTGEVQVSELAFMVPVYLIHMQGFLKALAFMPNKCHIENLVTKLGTSWRMNNLTKVQIEKKKSLLKRLNLSHSDKYISDIKAISRRFLLLVNGRELMPSKDLSKDLVFYWGSIIATWQNIMAPLIFTLFRRFVLYQDCDLQLPFGCIFPFNPVKNWFIYIIMYIFQAYSTFRVVYLYIGSEFIMITLCAYLTTEFSLLREDLQNVTPVANDILNNKSGLEQRQGTITIQQFIRRHQALIQLSKQLDGIFNRMIFIDLLFVTVIMCFFGFGATVAHGAVDKANNYIAVLALLFPIYVLCYYGELLKQESTGIADSAYETSWHLGGSNYQKMVGFIIMRSQKPCCLTSLDYTPITLNTFTKVVSTTWSYFSLAISVYSED